MLEVLDPTFVTLSSLKDTILLFERVDLKIRYYILKFDLGLLIAYKLMYFDRIINGNKAGKILVHDYCVLCNSGSILL